MEAGVKERTMGATVAHAAPTKTRVVLEMMWSRIRLFLIVVSLILVLLVAALVKVDGIISVKYKRI